VITDRELFELVVGNGFSVDFALGSSLRLGMLERLIEVSFFIQTSNRFDLHGVSINGDAAKLLLIRLESGVLRSVDDNELSNMLSSSKVNRSFLIDV
jgi:hypothetical protein